MIIMGIHLLGLCLFEFRIDHKRIFGWRFGLTVLTFTFDWVGYDYIRDSGKILGIQKVSWRQTWPGSSSRLRLFYWLRPWKSGP